MKRKKLNKKNRILYKNLFFVFLNIIFVVITVWSYGFKFQDMFYLFNNEFIVSDNDSKITKYKKRKERIYKTG